MRLLQEIIDDATIQLLQASPMRLLQEIIDDAGVSVSTDAIIQLYCYLKEKVLTDLTPDQITLTSSSGSSVVLIVTDSRHPVVYQYYRSPETFENIKTLCGICQSNCQQSTSLCIYQNNQRQSTQISIDYNFNDYRVLPVDYWPQLQTIVWERIQTLPERILIEKNFLYKNFNQLIWDLFKAISGFHSIGYTHGDSRIDNIGIKNGKFVLFDYNLSHLSPEEFLTQDFQMFAKSCQYQIRGSLPLTPFFLSNGVLSDTLQRCHMYQIQSLSLKIPVSSIEYTQFLITLSQQEKQTVEQTVQKLESSMIDGNEDNCHI